MTTTSSDSTPIERAGRETVAVEAMEDATKRAGGGRKDTDRKPHDNPWIVNGLRIGILAAFVAIWQVAVSMDWISGFFWGQPSQIMERYAEWIANGSLFVNIFVTITEAFWGLVIGVAAAIPLGVLIGSSQLLRKVTSPFIDAANATPRIALAPLFIIWFGLGPASRVALVVSIVFFIMLIATIAGVLAVDANHFRLGRLLGAKRGRLMTTIVLPSSRGYLTAGLRLSIPYALGAAVVGEMLTGTGGLGEVIVARSGALDTSGVLAAVLIMGLLGWLLYALADFFLAPERAHQFAHWRRSIAQRRAGTESASKAPA